MYSKLVLEVDRRVRLVANQVHALITANAKKKLAPLLKEFIGPWLLSMNDQSKDILRVAQNAFEVRLLDNLTRRYTHLIYSLYLQRTKDSVSFRFVKRKSWIMLPTCYSSKQQRH